MPYVALHASWNVVQRLKCLQTVQAIEWSVVVNDCKKSYYWSQVTIDHKLQQCLSGGYKIPIHSLLHVIEVLRQPSYVTSLRKLATDMCDCLRNNVIYYCGLSMVFHLFGWQISCIFDEVSLNAADLEKPGIYCQKRLNQITNSPFILILYFNSGSPQFLYYSGTYCMFNLSLFTTWNLFYSIPNTYTVKTNWLF